jgi:hypothetical protein
MVICKTECKNIQINWSQVLTNMSVRLTTIFIQGIDYKMLSNDFMNSADFYKSFTQFTDKLFQTVHLFLINLL